MELKLKHVEVDDFVGASVPLLREISASADALKRAVQDELKRQAQEALDALQETGESIVPPSGKKRGRKSNAEKAVELEANGVDDADVELDDEFASAGNA